MPEERPNPVSCELARATLGDLLSRVHHAGERIIITRHGRPFAALVPIEEAAQETLREGVAA